LKILMGSTAFAVTLMLCGFNSVFAEPFNNRDDQYISPSNTVRAAPVRYNTATYNARYGKKQKTPMLTEVDSSFNNRSDASALPVESRQLQRSRRCSVVDEVGFNQRDIATC